MTTAITARRGTAAEERINYIGVGVLQKDYTKSKQAVGITEMEGNQDRKRNQITEGEKKKKRGCFLLASLEGINFISAAGHEQTTNELESALYPLKGMNFLNC